MSKDIGSETELSYFKWSAGKVTNICAPSKPTASKTFSNFMLKLLRRELRWGSPITELKQATLRLDP